MTCVCLIPASFRMSQRVDSLVGEDPAGLTACRRSGMGRRVRARAHTNAHAHAHAHSHTHTHTHTGEEVFARLWRALDGDLEKVL